MSEEHQWNNCLGIDEIRRSNLKVSSRSRWNDHNWYLDNDTPGYSSTSTALHWPVDADPAVVNGLKLVAAHLFLRGKAETQYKPTTASSVSAGMRYLARFMMRNDYRRFDQLNEASFEKYCRELGRNLSSTDEMDDAEFFGLTADESEAPLEAGHDAGFVEDSLGLSAAFYRLRVWKHLYDHREQLNRQGLVCFAFDPFDETSPMKLAGAIANEAVEVMPPLPDEVARQIMNVAQTFIDGPASEILELQSQYLLIAPDLTRELNGAERKRARNLLTSMNFSTVNDSEADWVATLSSQSELKLGFGYIMKRMLVTIQSACAIVILSETGIRISELCSISVPEGSANDLPSCISSRPSKTQLNEHFFVTGLVSKHRASPEEDEWLIGGRPMGSINLPPAVKAISILAKMNEPWRQFGGFFGDDRPLLLHSLGGLPHDPSSIQTTSSHQLRMTMKDFIERFARLAEVLAPLASGKPELDPYLKSRGRNIRPHQWRKTFLTFLLRIDDGLLPAISQHFKHLSLAITEDGYAPKDPALYEAADSVRNRQAAKFIYEKLRGTSADVSRMDQQIRRNSERIEEIIGPRNFEDAADELVAYVDDHDLRIFFSPHGRCMIGLNPKEARCNDDGSGADWKRRSPNYAHQSPSLCLGCANFSVGPDDIGFWRRRYSENQTAWVESGRSDQYFVARKRAEQAAKILSALGVDVAEIREGERPDAA